MRPVQAVLSSLFVREAMDLNSEFRAFDEDRWILTLRSVFRFVPQVSSWVSFRSLIHAVVYRNLLVSSQTKKTHLQALCRVYANTSCSRFVSFLFFLDSRNDARQLEQHSGVCFYSFPSRFIHLSARCFPATRLQCDSWHDSRDITFDRWSCDTSMVRQCRGNMI